MGADLTSRVDPGLIVEHWNITCNLTGRPERGELKGTSRDTHCRWVIAADRRPLARSLIEPTSNGHRRLIPAKFT